MASTTPRLRPLVISPLWASTSLAAMHPLHNHAGLRRHPAFGQMPRHDLILRLVINDVLHPPLLQWLTRTMPLKTRGDIHKLGVQLRTQLAHRLVYRPQVINHHPIRHHNPNRNAYPLFRHINRTQPPIRIHHMRVPHQQHPRIRCQLMNPAHRRPNPPPILCRRNPPPRLQHPIVPNDAIPGLVRTGSDRHNLRARAQRPGALRIPHPINQIRRLYWAGILLNHRTCAGSNERRRKIRLQLHRIRILAPPAQRIILPRLYLVPIGGIRRKRVPERHILRPATWHRIVRSWIAHGLPQFALRHRRCGHHNGHCCHGK